MKYSVNACKMSILCRSLSFLSILIEHATRMFSGRSKNGSSGAKPFVPEALKVYCSKDGVPGSKRSAHVKIM